MPDTGPYRLPEHARKYFGSERNGQWGGVPWAKSEREAHSFKGCPANALQWFKPLVEHKFPAVFWQSCANIDSDGPSPSIRGEILHQRDPYWQRETSLQFENPWIDADGRKTRACDSRTFCGVVIPPRLRIFGLEVGDFCLVCWGGTIVAAQAYDIGPQTKLGEISQGLAYELSLPHNPNKPYNRDSNRGDDPRAGNGIRDLCVLAFPGSGMHKATSKPDQWEMAREEFERFTGRITG